MNAAWRSAAHAVLIATISGDAFPKQRYILEIHEFRSALNSRFRNRTFRRVTRS